MIAMYSSAQRESMARMELTRERRLREDHPELSGHGKDALIRQYHPTVVVGGLREISVGSNKGDCVPKELAELLEGNSAVNPDIVDLAAVNYDVDVLVLGFGGAGAAAALS